MSQNACPVHVSCNCADSPLTGYSALSPDAPDFVATGFATVVPALGNTSWIRLTCMQFASSAQSQVAAEVLAYQQALLCALGAINPDGGGGGSGPSPFVFFNAPQSCTVNCPDGSPFTFDVPAGVFIGTSQLDADTQAETFACAQAAQRAVCLGPLTPASGTINVPYSGSITASGGDVATGPPQTNLWMMVSGSLPMGLTFNGGALSSNQVTITGTPTEIGTFNFSVEITDPLGATMTKSYSLFIGCTDGFTLVTNSGTGAALPVPYANQIAIEPMVPAADKGFSCFFVDRGVLVPVGSVNTLKLTFVTNTLKTWTWRADSGNQGTDITSLTINGISQTYLPNGALITATGTFNTDACIPVVVELVFTSGFFGQGSSFQWATPP